MGVKTIKRLVVLLLLLPQVVRAQQAPEFLSSDYVPEKKDIVRKIDSITSEVRKDNLYEKRSIRASQIRFIYESVFYNHNIKQGGQIIYNKELDQYLHSVVEHLVKSNPEKIGDGVEISVLRSSVINAFASDEGNLFITLGLLARLENEAQLAYVLSHELSHWVRKHGLEKVSEEVRIKTDKKSESYFSKETKVIEIHSFSQEIELDADELGYEFYTKAGYHTEDIDGVFDILALSSLPMDTTALDFKYPFTDIAMSSKYIDTTGENFVQEDIESEENSFSTHPNLSLRRENVESQRVINKSSGGKKYIELDPEKFKRIKELAEYNIGKYYLYDMQFYSAYCHNFYLNNKYDTKYTHMNLMSSWLGMLALRTERMKDKYTDYYTTYNDGYKIKSFFKDSPKDVLKLASVVSALKLYESDPKDEDYRDLLYLTFDIIRKNPKKSSSRRNKNKLEAEFVDELMEYSLSDGDEVKLFKEYWDGLDSNYKENLFDSYSKSRAIDEDPDHDLVEQGILFVNPGAFYVDENTITRIDLKATLDQNEAFYNNLKQSLDKYDVNYKILSYEDSSRSHVDLVDHIFNTRLLLKQNGIRGKSSRKPTYNLMLTNGDIEALSEKFQSRYIAFAGMLVQKSSLGERKLITAIKTYFSMLTILGMPQGTTSLYYNHHEVTFYALIYDTKLKEFVHSDVDTRVNQPNNKYVPKYLTQYKIYELMHLTDLSENENN